MNPYSNPGSRHEVQPGASRARGSELQRGLWWIERICLLAGVALLLAFAGLRLSQAESGQAGLAAFYQQVQVAERDDQALASTPTSTFTSTHPPGNPAAADSAVSGQQSRPPGFELWSEKRIHEYQQSLLQAADPPLGVLRIDRLHIEVPVYNGTDEFVLNRGVGRIPGTARIDGAGNLGIAGHRDGFFRGLKDIQAGDILELQTTHGAVSYRVDSMVIVDPSDVSVLAPTPERTLTLVTCYPFYFVGHAPKRFIVRATAEPQIAMN